MMSFSMWLKLTARMIGNTVASAGTAGFITASAIASSHFVAQHHFRPVLLPHPPGCPCHVRPQRYSTLLLRFHSHERTAVAITAGDLQKGGCRFLSIGRFM